MREVIMTGKTVEEATELAFAELGVAAEDASVEVLELPHRRFFKTIPAKVRVSVEEPEALEKTEAPAPAPKAEKPVQEKAKPAPKPAPAPVEEPAVQPAAEESEKPEETPVDLEANPKAKVAVEYLKEVAACMGATKITVEAVRQGETIILKVEGEDSGILIGHRGEVMESLSYLCSLAANRVEGDYAKIGLDVNHYRAKREANLEALAKRIAAKVARTGRSHTLEPMNPYERRIIHSAVSQVEGVKSESTGEGANRRVVIMSTDPAARKDSRDRREKRGGKGGRQGRGRGGKGSREPRSSTPGREFADRPRDPSAAPVVPVRTETINDGADLPLFGKIEL